MRKILTKEEIRQILEMYPTTDSAKIAEIFSIKIDTVKTIACRNKVKKSLFFTDWEISKIIEMYPSYKISEICEVLGRTEGSIISKAEELGVKRESFWTKKEIELLKKIYPKKSKSYILNKIEKKWTTIKAKARKLKIIRLNKNGVSYKIPKKITKTEERYIKENHIQLTIGTMAKALGRNHFFVKSYCEKMRFKAKERYSIDTKNVSNEEIILEVLEISNSINRTPTLEDLKSFGCSFYIDTIFKRFGTYNKLLELANLKPNYSPAICYSKNGDLCLSSGEQKITNFLIDNSLRYEKEKYYSGIIPNFNKRYRMDWYLIDLNIVVEFFGYFNPKTKTNYEKRSKEKIRLLNKNGIQSIFIYKKDILNLKKIFSHLI
jgi:hypothetical protein